MFFFTGLPQQPHGCLAMWHISITKKRKEKEKEKEKSNPKDYIDKNKNHLTQYNV